MEAFLLRLICFLRSQTFYLRYVSCQWIEQQLNHNLETLPPPRFRQITKTPTPLSFVFSHLLSVFLCSFTQTRIKVTDLSGTFWTGKELGIFSSLTKWQEISMPLRAWIGKGNRIMSCMRKPWIGTRRRPWSQSQSSSLKYKTSMIMHPNFQMDHL